ncbi:GYD domain-containing protein [Nitratireductor rhodophyticola]|uniref:GYD domain-containing protein n=1 Tax=Nitratireductor rhodophyticola TaxID=2854036 RepID=UPI002AC984B2|nr:GYD domain-containing protein [Nitratireductor rhodophyticola]WPZ12944.1 GYD domain-containing protein [Nitratireductor rhodophyticola]
MTTYVILLNWTDQGIKSVKESPKRLEAAKAVLSQMGGTLRAFYLTMGAHDMVAVAEAPDDAVAARFALTIGMGGNVRTQVMKAFPEAAYIEIISSLA